MTANIRALAVALILLSGILFAYALLGEPAMGSL